ncbi:hypothetical protein VTH06DRAFT_2075 [Thermothelomyces fergusii]
MKPIAFLVSTLATLTVAAPAAPASGPEERAVAFDINAFNGFQSLSQVNLNYLLNINSLQLTLLGNLASVNNLNIVQFQPLFQHQVFDIQGLLQLQSLHTFLQISQVGVLNGFDLATLQLQHLNLGLLNNISLIDLQRFISPEVAPRVKSIADEVVSPK